MRQHALVNGDPLVWQRVDLADLGGEDRIEQVAVGQAFTFNQDANGVRVTEKVQAASLLIGRFDRGTDLARLSLVGERACFTPI